MAACALPQMTFSRRAAIDKHVKQDEQVSGTYILRLQPGQKARQVGKSLTHKSQPSHRLHSGAGSARVEATPVNSRYE